MSSPDSESIWFFVRSHVIIPLLPYYYVAVALIAFYINPRMFVMTVLVVFAILILVTALSVLFSRHGPEYEPPSPPRSEDQTKSHELLKDELDKLAHEEKCTTCRENRMKEEFVKRLARKLWEDERGEREADEEIGGARVGGRKGKKRNARKI